MLSSGSPPPTMYRLPRTTVPSVGAPSVTKRVLRRVSGPSSSSAAAAETSFRFDAGTSGAASLSADGEEDLESLGGFTGFYVRLLRGALRHPGKVVLAAVAVGWFIPLLGISLAAFVAVDALLAVRQNRTDAARP